MAAPTPMVPGEIAPVVPEQQDAAQRGDHAGEHVGGDAMRRHVEADRLHAARAVANALQRKAERRSGHVERDEIAERREAEQQVVERRRLGKVDAEHARRPHAVDAVVAVEDVVVLEGEIGERRADRERDHDRIDAVGAHREQADGGADGD